MVSDETFRAVMTEYLEKVGGDDARQRLFNPLKRPHEDPRFKELVQKDLEAMVDRVDLDLKDPVVRILLVQSVLGHAQNGHCEFGELEYIFPHATIPDIIAAAGLDVQKTKQERQALVDDVYKWVNTALDKRVQRLVIDGKPLMGVKFLREHSIEPVDVLKGMVMGGFMDNFDYRQKTIAHYRLTTDGRELEIGGGETFLVDPRTLLTAGMDFNFLAENEHDEEALQYLRNLDILVAPGTKGAESAYIRRKKGHGTSDDLAFIVIGKKHGISAMLGAFVIDAIDTYDKCVMYPAEKGLDEVLGAYIQDAWKSKMGEPLVSDAEIMEVIYYSAKGNHPRVNVSSSHRRFVQFEGEDKLYRPTMTSHIAFVEGKPTGKFEVGFSRMQSETFYSRAKKRVSYMEAAGV